MNPVARFVEAVSFDINPRTFALPSLMMDGLCLFGYLRGLWKINIKTKIYTDKDNTVKLIAGHALYWGIGNSGFSWTAGAIKISAHFCLVSSKIIDFTHQKEKVSRASEEMRYAFWGVFSVSKEGLQTAHFAGNHLIFRVYTVVSCVFCLTWQWFLLSMYFLDAIDAVRASNYEALTEWGVHGGRALNELIENKQLLLHKLQTNKKVIERIIGQMGFKIKADSMINGIAKILNGAEAAAPYMQRVSKTGFEALKDSLQTTCFALTGWTPGFLLPNGNLGDDPAQAMNL